MRKGDDAATEKTRGLFREFVREFITRHGSITYTELPGYNLSDPEEYETAREKKLFVTKCPGLVRDAAGILEKML